MQVIPVDVARLGLVLCALLPEVKKDRETGAVRKDREGREVWQVGVMVTELEGRRAAVISVSVPGEPVGLEAGAPVKVSGLVAQQWEMGGRRGISFRADSIAPAAPAAPAAGKGR
jgi:hypothetical protein